MNNRFLVALLIPALAGLLPACRKPAGGEPASVPPVAKGRSTNEVKPGVALEPKAPASTVTNSSRQVLVFRNVRSWNRKADFEEVLTDAAFKFDVRSSGEMGSTDLAPYLFVVIPGAQWQDDYYRDYADNSARFERYVTNGGTLVLELNGAERDGITLPGGASMVRHGATDTLRTLVFQRENPRFSALCPKEKL